MKSNLLALMSALIGFTSGGLITYKLLNRKPLTSGSFRELYEDNSKALKGGDI